METPSELTIGDWRVRPRFNAIERGGLKRRLQPRIMDLLLRLADSAGDVVTRDELFRDVWPGVRVSDDVLTRSVSVLRAALGDARHGRTYITTIPKRGYILNASVGRAASEGESAFATGAVAVAAFADASTDASLAGFCAGLRDAIATALSALPGVRVAAPGARAAAELEGSVRREGDRLLVVARLVDARQRMQRWAESVSALAHDAAALQRDVAHAIAARFSLQVGERSLSGPTSAAVRADAWEHYVRARKKYQAERASFRFEGLAELERAIELDHRFAAAHGLHAYVNALRAVHEGPFSRVSAHVRSSYQRALALDPLQPEALMAKALDVRWRSWDWREMRVLFEQAARVTPGDPHVLAHFAARFFRELGELDTAERMLRRALALDDAENPTARVLLSSVLRFRGDFAAAREEAARVRETHPHHSWALLAYTLAALEQRDFDAAGDCVREVQSLAGFDHRMTLEARGRLEALSGEETRARKTLARMRSFAREDAIYADAAAWVCFELGEVEEGSALLERAILEGANACALARVCMLPIEARRPGVLGSPRFQAVLARMHLDDASLAQLAAEGVLDPPLSFGGGPRSATGGL